MIKIFILLTLVFLLNGCANTLAFLGGAAGGASSGRVLQSSLNSAISYEIKKQTGKTPIGHALAYAEKKNPQRKKETCISFVEKSRSEFCTIIKKQITSTNIVIKKKVTSIVVNSPKIKNPAVPKKLSKTKTIVIVEDKNFSNSLIQSKKSPRELAIAYQLKRKKHQIR